MKEKEKEMQTRYKEKKRRGGEWERAGREETDREEGRGEDE